ncbi:MAG: D-alanyl-D-alanine carboxypeptidase family protein [Pseudomonadota bacterium]|nr:D-alanyl-D-alanine carboxypeptidase family protein [Pseudomonadota bacterium]
MKINKSGLAVLLCGAVCGYQAMAFETAAQNAILMDYDTGEYLFAKNIEESVPPASMSKLMTVYILMSKIKDGSIKLDDTFSVSENAWRKGGAATGGSTMFLSIGDNVSVENLIKGIVIQSGNDACIVVAENLSGSEDDFVILMNKTAKKLGLKNSHFENATGLPHPDHRMSMEDLAILSRHIIKEFPDLYHYFSQKEFVYNNIKQGNRNPLLYTMKGADGLKTGHTEEAGFCLAASAAKGERRLIEVMSGMSSNRERSEEAERLISWGFREFNNFKFFNKGQTVASAKVWYGKENKVDLTVPEDVLKTVHMSQQDNVKVTAEFDEPVKAPIKAGQKIGSLKIEIENQRPLSIPLVAAKDVAETGMFGKFWSNFKYFVFGAK